MLFSRTSMVLRGEDRKEQPKGAFNWHCCVPAACPEEQLQLGQLW